MGMKLINSVALKQEIANVMPSRTEVFLVIDGMPDALVRCENCWRKGNPFECRLASDVQEHGGSITEEYDDWFCADGERKES